MRLLIEGVVLAAAHENAEYYGEELSELKRDWRLKDLTLKMKRAGLHHFPEPCDFGVNADGKHFLHVLKDKNLDFNELFRLHGSMGNLLHRRFHFLDTNKTHDIMQEIINFLPEIKNHLSNHVLYIRTDDGLKVLVVNMNFHRKKTCECMEIDLKRI